MNDAAPPSTAGDSLFERTSLAAMRAELGLVPPAQQNEAKRLVQASDEHFDGTRLVELCLEGRASDDARVLHRALLVLRSRFVESGTGSTRPRRRRPNFLVRFAAGLTAKLIFASIYTVVLVALLIVLRHHFDWANIYELGDWVLQRFGVK